MKRQTSVPSIKPGPLGPGSMLGTEVCLFILLSSSPELSEIFKYPSAGADVLILTSRLNPPILAPPLMERCFRSTPKGVLTAQDYGVAVMGSWQISQRPLTVHKGEWGDRLLSRVMAWCLVHWTLSH